MALHFVLFLLLISTCVAWDNGVARTPPLAWSSWYALSRGTSCTGPENRLSQENVLKNAEAIVASGLAKKGFNTMVIDDCWQAANRDGQGFLHADPVTFPDGMSWLVKNLRSKSIKLGLYTTPGHFSCMKRPASQGYEEQDVKLWLKEWGVRYLKYCVCNTTHERRLVAYGQMQQYIAETNLSVVYEIDPAMEKPMTSMDGTGHVVGAHDDVADEYSAWVDAISELWSWGVYSGNHTRPGHWPLIDILQVGRGGQTQHEYRSQVSMYVMLCSPLILGVDFSNFTWAAAALEYVSNDEVLAVHQDTLGKHAARVTRHTSGSEIWVRPLQDGGFAVALWNVNATSAVDISFSTKTLTSASAKWFVRDIWSSKDLGYADGEWTARNVQQHELILLRLTPASLSLAI